ncbi:MAG: uroporphyrinogen decarboxylase family protein [candidate division KSB1 bacterium]|jgi:hypothetical protein|nr:uroporphyrinogen decarboxylase family protein [candidate division KSB1 bacterium]
MTIKERILSVYRNQTPDQLPFAIYNRYHRYGESERSARNSGMGILDFIPAVSLLAPPWHVKPGYVSEVKNAGFNVKVVWDKGEEIEVRSFETPVGTITQETVKDPTYGSDWIRKHYLNSPEDYKIMQYIVENTLFRSQDDVIDLRMKDLGDDGVVLGRIDRSPYQKLLIELMDPQKFLIDLLTEPAPLVELMEQMDDKLDEQIEMALNTNVEVIWSPDNVTADMTPPDAFERYCLPFYQKHGAQCRDAGKVYAVHMDGRINGIKHLVARCPIDVIESFSLADMSGDVSIADAKMVWPDKVLCPNFPASWCDKTPEFIQERLTSLKQEFFSSPFMIQISEDIPLHSYSHVITVLSEFFS